MKEFFSKLLEMLADIIRIIANNQLIDAGKSKICNQINQKENKREKDIKQIQKDVHNLSDNDIERMLNIEIRNK